MAITTRKFFLDAGFRGEELQRLGDAWARAPQLHITLWVRPYTEERLVGRVCHALPGAFRLAYLTEQMSRLCRTLTYAGKSVGHTGEAKLRQVRYLRLRAGRSVSVAREVDERRGPPATSAAALTELAAARPAANHNTTR